MNSYYCRACLTKASKRKINQAKKSGFSICTKCLNQSLISYPDPKNITDYLVEYFGNIFSTEEFIFMFNLSQKHTETLKKARNEWDFLPCDADEQQKNLIEETLKEIQK